MDDSLELLSTYARTRDAQAFAAIVKRHQNLVYSVCLREYSDPHRAEEAAQECFVKLAQQAANVRTSLSGWLHRCATRVCLQSIRSERARKRREETYAQMQHDEPEQPSGWASIGPHVDHAIDQLPDQQRHLVVEHFLRQRPQAEIASELSISPATVSRRIDAAVRALRDDLRRLGMVVSVPLLAGLLAENAVSAVPASLTAALGKVAIAGPGATGTGATAAAGAGSILGVGAAKLAVSAALVALVIALPVVYRLTAGAEPKAPVPAVQRAQIGATVPGDGPTAQIEVASGGGGGGGGRPSPEKSVIDLLHEIAEASEAHFRQVKAVEIEATLTTRDLTNGGRLQDEVSHAVDSFTKALARARSGQGNMADAHNIATLETLLAGAEHGVVAGYLNRYSVRSARLFFDRRADLAWSLFEWNKEDQRRRALALGLSPEDVDACDVLGSAITLREGNQVLRVTRRPKWPGRPMVELSPTPAYALLPSRDLTLEPVTELGLFRPLSVEDFPFSESLKNAPGVSIKRTKEERDDLLVVTFSPRTLTAMVGRGIRLTVSFRPSLGFRIVERRETQGGKIHRIERFEYARWDGRVFIKEYQRTDFEPAGQPLAEELLSVHRAVFSESLPREAFRTELPAGTLIHDAAFGKYTKLEAAGPAGSRIVSVSDILDQLSREFPGRGRR